MKIVRTIAIILLIIGGLNWGLVGLFDVDLVAGIFGRGTTLARIVYILVGLAAVVKIALLLDRSSRSNMPVP